MLQAETKTGKLITLASLSPLEITHIRKNHTFYCPQCKEKVIVRAGPKTIPHFAHHRHSTCPNNNGGEGYYHLQGKHQLYEWLLGQQMQVKTEVYFDAIQQRADIYLPFSKKQMVLEYQCTRIPLQKIAVRNEGYRALNITPLWILGANLLRSVSTNLLKIDTFTQRFIHHFPKFPTTFLYYYCPEKKRFTLKQDIVLINQRRALASIQSIPLRKSSLLTLFYPNRLRDDVLFSHWKKAKETFRLSSIAAYGKELAWRRWLYEKGYYVERLPSVVYLPSRYQHLFTVSLWNWQSRFIIDFLLPLPLGTVFSVQEAEQFLAPYMIEETSFAQQESDLKTAAVNEYLTYLERAELIKEIKRGVFRIQSSIPFYYHIEDAIRGDAELLHRFMYNRRKKTE